MQVTGCDYCAVQQYIIGVIASGVPQSFLTTIHSLLDFCYLAQASTFTAHSVNCIAQALQEFHDHKDAIICHSEWDNWELLKLELLQSVVPGICQSKAPMQWTAHVMEHAHVNEIKVPAHARNNQNYYNRIAHHLDRLDKCFRFDLAMYIKEQHHMDPRTGEGLSEDWEDNHEHNAEMVFISKYVTPTCPIIDYFSASHALLNGSNSTVPQPFQTFATSTTTFHIAIKPSLQLTVAEAALKYKLPDFILAVSSFLAQQNCSSVPMVPDNIQLQILHSLHVQQMSYHTGDLEPPQTLCAIPSSATNPYGEYNLVIVGDQPESDWPKCGLDGHGVAQLWIIFWPLHCYVFTVYVQHFHIGSVSTVTGICLLKWSVRVNGNHIGEVIPLTFICSPSHLIPNFGAEAHSYLNKLSSYELSTNSGLTNIGWRSSIICYLLTRFLLPVITWHCITYTSPCVPLCSWMHEPSISSDYLSCLLSSLCFPHLSWTWWMVLASPWLLRHKRARFEWVISITKQSQLRVATFLAANH